MKNVIELLNRANLREGVAAGIALCFLLLLAACSSGLPGKLVQAPGAGIEPPPSPVSPAVPQRIVGDYLIVDKSERLLVVYSAGRPIRAYRGLQFGAAPGGHKRFQGDERTPEGVYVIDTRNPASRFHLSLRISYPNAADRAFAAQSGRSPGGDIFLHGQPTGRPGRMDGDWTDGCIALSNAEIEELWQIVPDGTRIEIRP